MSIEVRVPQLPESVTDATLVAWHKKPGEAFGRGQPDSTAGAVEQDPQSIHAAGTTPPGSPAQPGVR